MSDSNRIDPGVVPLVAAIARHRESIADAIVAAVREAIAEAVRAPTLAVVDVDGLTLGGLAALLHDQPQIVAARAELAIAASGAVDAEADDDEEEEQDDNECGACGGSGGGPDPALKCRACGGSGWGR